MYLILLFGRNAIHHAVNVVDIIIYHSCFFLSSVWFSAVKATNNLGLIPCHVLFVMFLIKQ